MGLSGDIRNYVMSRKQCRFHESTARTRLVKGGNRSGKTVMGAAELVMMAIGACPSTRSDRLKPPVHLWAVSLDFPVSSTIVEPLVRQLIPREMIEKDDKRERRLTLINGSTIEFKSVDQGWEKFQGASCEGVWFDERPLKIVYKECVLRTIDVSGDIWITMTPVLGEDWTTEELYDPWLAGDYETDPNGCDDMDVIEITSFDNPFLPESELRRMGRTLSEQEIRSRLYGDYVALEGLVFPEFSPAVHQVVSLEDLPNDGRLERHWEKVISLDPAAGKSKTASHLLARRDDGVIVVAGEYYASYQSTIQGHAEGIRRMVDRAGLTEMPIVYYDPAALQVAVELTNLGIVTARANNDVAGGIARMREALFVDREGKTGMLLYPEVQQFPKELGRYCWRPETALSDGGGSVVKKRDDCVDSVRYGVMALPRSNVVRAKPPACRATAMMEGYWDSLISTGSASDMRAEFGPDGLG